MGSVISTVSLRIFEFCNEIFVAAASGVVGIFMLTYKGLLEAQYLRTLFVTTLTVGCLVYTFQSTDQIEPCPDKVVFITGCDSGLGFSLAQHLCDLGFTVIAGCLKGNSKGAKELKEYNHQKIIVIELDITNDVNVHTTVETVSKYIDSRRYVLWAVINNAGMMVFGEFEWQTINLINRQINVNLSGTLKVTKSFSHLLRKHKARLITITSHCAFVTLPGLAVYGATKAALQAWNDGLRIELGKYGVNVVSFVPGSFVSSSDIMAKQADYAHEMIAAFTTEQKRFYGEYFKRYHLFLSVIPTPTKPLKIECEGMYKKFEQALMDIKPKRIYVHESWNYKLYHTLFRYSPTPVRDYFIRRFMQMPEYNTEGMIPEALT